MAINPNDITWDDSPAINPQDITWDEPKAKATLPPITDRLKRQAGLTARYLTEGIVGTGDILTSPIRGALNLVLPESLQSKPLAPALTRNLPQPETTMERMVAGPSRALASTLGTGGIGTLARPVSQLGKTIQQAFTANAPTQAAAATGGGLGQAGVQELGGGQVAQTLAGLGGTLAGAGYFVRQPPGCLGITS